MADTLAHFLPPFSSLPLFSPLLPLPPFFPLPSFSPLPRFSPPPPPHKQPQEKDIGINFEVKMRFIQKGVNLFRDSYSGAVLPEHFAPPSAKPLVGELGYRENSANEFSQALNDVMRDLGMTLSDKDNDHVSTVRKHLEGKIKELAKQQDQFSLQTSLKYSKALE